MTSNVIIDLSHHNKNVDLVKARQSGILAVINKATQGSSGVDVSYSDRRTKAANAKMLFGAYHFGTNGSGIQQADHFLNTVKPDPNTLLVLDFEPNTDSTMTLAQAKAFVSRVYDVTRRYPVLYSGNLIKEQLGNKPVDAILANCPLWIAQYGPAVTNIPRTWKTWTLWQYTDGNVGPEPHTVAGIGPCDRDMFNGPTENLYSLWGRK